MGLIALNVALILHLSVYLAGDFPEFDEVARLKLWIGIAAALVGIVISALLLRAPIQIDQSRWHTLFMIGSAALLILLAFLPVPPFTSPHLAHVHTLITLMIGIGAIYLTLFDGEVSLKNPRLWLLIGIGAAVVISLIRIYALSWVPFIDTQDEAWTTAWTLTWMRTGQFGDPTLGGLGDAYYAYPRFYWLMGLWWRLTGVGLWQGRLLNFLLIFPVIGLTALVAKAWYGKAAALFTAVFLFCSAVVMSGARIRHDMGLTLCVAGSLWLYTVAIKRNRMWLHFLAGVLMAWGIFSHYHGVGMGLALFIGLYVPDYLAQVGARSGSRWWLPKGGAWLYALGGIAGGVSVLLIQMIPDDLPGWLWSLQHQAKYSSDGSQFFLALFGNVFNIAYFSIFEFLLIGAGIIAALRRRGSRDVSLLLMFVVGHIMLAVMGAGAIYYYILPMVPIYGILTGTLLFNRQEDQSISKITRRQAFLYTILLIPLLGVSAGQSLQATVEGKPIDPPAPAAVAWIRDNVPMDAEIVADMYYYLWLNDYTFTSHLVPDFLYPENIERLTTTRAIWEAVDMDVLVIDPNLERSYMKYFQPLLATGLIDERYTVAAEIPTEKGTVTIYRRNTPKPSVFGEKRVSIVQFRHG